MIVGIVLAAGRSSRLGRPKQLLPVGGEPLLRYTLGRVLASSLDQVTVVVGHEADEVRAALAGFPVGLVLNPDAALGQSTSVIAGMLALPPETEAAVMLLGDQPEVEPTVIDALIAAWRETRAPVVAPRYSDGMGNPVLFDRSLFPELTTLAGDTGARPIVLAHRNADTLLLVPVASPAPPDVDTEEDYAALLASLPPAAPPSAT
ncbi:MAG: nucleotidyltransferase family protein [Chloroflexia bacterium]|nr:nucleotidyltransferase family protein [Chloroflexia bacterium]